MAVSNHRQECTRAAGARSNQDRRTVAAPGCQDAAMRYATLPDGVRVARPQDYDAIASVVDAWWGRPMLDFLPRLFLDLSLIHI